jgi:hypothetical protein
MTQIFRRIAVAAAATAVAGLILTGCSSKDDAEETTSAPAVTTSAEAPVTEEPTEAPEPADSGSQAEKLDAFIEEARAEVESQVDMFGGTYSDISLSSANGNTLVYTYTFAEPIDAAVAAESFDSMSDMLKGPAENMLIPALEMAGVTDNPQVTYTYLNPDGSVIWTKTYSAP